MRTVGVEEELLLVDVATGVPVAVASTLLARAERASVAAQDDAGKIEAELQQQQIEVDTRPCETLDALHEEVVTWRSRAAELAEPVGARVAALATSPLPVTPTTTVKPRYQRMAEQFGLTTLEQLTCGAHVHVSVTSEDEGVAVLDRIRVWLPAVLALSANSPFWNGTDSGYASFRAQAWARFPSAGAYDVAGTAAAYHQRVADLVASEVLLDEAMLYHDARLSASYPTVEIRAADVCLDAEDSVTLAGLIRALVETAATDWRAGRAAPELPTALLALARWRASRSGVRGPLLDPRHSRPVATTAVVADLLAYVGDALLGSGDDARVRLGVAAILSRGSGADVQRRAAERTDGDLAAVVRECCARTHARPTPTGGDGAGAF